MYVNDTALSTITRAPISYFVYSAFSYLGARGTKELPGSWFVKALSAAGREEAGVRQTLYRMERDGELTARRAGRTKFYTPSDYARAEIEAGAAKIFEHPRKTWDGRWTMVHVGLRGDGFSKHRERVVALLAVEGFARVDANLFVHPTSSADRLVTALPDEARKEVLVLRGDLVIQDAQSSLLSLWGLDRLKERYGRLVAKLERLEARAASDPSDVDAFLMRFEVVFDYLSVAWDDPELPAALLPPGWPGAEARERAARLYERLLPQATRYAEELLAEVVGRSHRRTGGKR